MCRLFQRQSFSGSVPDTEYSEWFSGSCVTQNVRETIREILVPISVEEDFTALSSSHDSSLDEMFQLAPSTLLGIYYMYMHATE